MMDAVLRAEIVSQGDEVVSGQTVDSNAAWLAEQLTTLGFQVIRHTTVGDRVDDIREALEQAAGRCDLLLCSGGLGPTDDDLTADAVAAVLGVSLVFDEQAMQQIETMFSRFGKPMPDSNRKQALLPEGSQRLDNRWGTAPGFAVELGSTWMAFVPGVPREMTKMFQVRLVPLIRERFDLHPGSLVTLRTVAAGESRLQTLIGPWRHPGVTLGYRAIPPEVQIKLRFPAGFPDEERERVVSGLAARIGLPVFVIEGLMNDYRGGDLATVTLALLAARGLGLAVGEQGGGGRLATMLHGAPGGDGLACALVCGNDGEVSATQAVDFARRARESGAADLGLGLSLCADPESAQAGRGHVALVGIGVEERRPIRVAGARGLMQTLGAAAAVDLLRRWLLAGGGWA
jgi:competence/damage-inducible protein CinA-like protein